MVLLVFLVFIVLLLMENVSLIILQVKDGLLFDMLLLIQIQLFIIQIVMEIQQVQDEP